MQELQPISTRGDKPKRGTPFALVEIDCRNTSSQLIPGGIIVPNGVHRARVEQSVVPVLMSQVEDRQDEVVRAGEQYERDLQEHIAKHMDESTLPSDRAQRVEELRATFSGSPSAIFRASLKREMRPFAGVKVIESGLLADEDDDRVAAEEKIGARIAAAVAAALEARQTQSQPQQQQKR